MIDPDSDNFRQSPLGYIYWCLRTEKHRHEVALWAAWCAHKADKAWLAALGLPEHQYELAQLLGVSDRTIRNYHQKHGRLLETARAMMVEHVLADYVPSALRAMGEVAGKATNEGTADRRLLFEVAGVYTPKQKAVNLDVDVTGLSDKELDDLLKRLG
ncbi:MAG: hypothetical protein KF770_10630 [Anaerolineae bacterium]|nr:hypothetical protein [Anaerolineae bacterium]